jgi:hypothetical protein
MEEELRSLVAKTRNKILVNDQIDAKFFFYVYFNSLHVSSNLVLIIRRISCMNTTSGVCHSVYELPDLQTEGHLHRVTYTRCCIHTINSPDNEHGVARNM